MFNIVVSKHFWGFKTMYVYVIFVYIKKNTEQTTMSQLATGFARFIC